MASNEPSFSTTTNYHVPLPIPTPNFALVAASSPDFDPAVDKPQVCEVVKTYLRDFRNATREESTRLANEARSSGECYASLHRVNAGIFRKLAETHDVKNLSKAVTAAETAVRFSPRSIEYRLCLAQLLFESARDDEVIGVCEEALAVEDPIDPFWQGPCLGDDRFKNSKTPEEGVAFVADELRELIRECQSKKNQQEEQLQPPPPSYGKLVLDARQKKKGYERARQRYDKMLQAKEYWENSMSPDEKRSFFEVNIKDLRKHWSKEGKAGEVIETILGIILENRDWNVFKCFTCKQFFQNWDTFMVHTKESHIKKPTKKNEKPLPENLPLVVSERFLDTVRNGCWEPIDATAAVEEKEEQQRLKVRSALTCIDLKDTFVSEYDAFCRNSYKEKEDDYLSDANKMSENGAILLKWSLSFDAKRIDLLNQIRGTFRSLSELKRLCASHVASVLRLAINFISDLPYGSELVNLLPLHDLPLCLCFLEASQLDSLLGFLLGVLSAGEENEINLAIEPFDADWEFNLPMIFITSDSSLCLDVNFFKSNVASADTEKYSANDGMEKVNVDKLLSWIFVRDSLLYQLKMWKKMDKLKNQYVTQRVIEVYISASTILTAVGVSKGEWLTKMAAIRSLTKLCLEEKKRREQTEECTSDFITVLRNRKEELNRIENGLESASDQSKCEATTITEVLKKADELNNSGQVEYDKKSTVTSYLRDLASRCKDDNRNRDHLLRVDSSVKVMIQLQCQAICLKLNMFDAKMMPLLNITKELDEILKAHSFMDYGIMCLAPMLSLLSIRMKELLEKDAVEKSEIAIRALLAEEEKDSKCSMARETVSSKLPKVKKKDKRKQKKTEKIFHDSDADNLEADSEPSTGHLKQEADEEEFEQNFESFAYQAELVETLESRRETENKATQEQIEKHLKMVVGDSLGKLKALAATTYPISNVAKGSADRLKQEEDKEGDRQNVEHEAKQEQTEKHLKRAIEDFSGNVLFGALQLDPNYCKSSFPDDDDDDDDNGFKDENVGQLNVQL